MIGCLVIVGRMNDVTIFAPSPILTVTVEGNPGGEEVHIHAGGQGVWQARMLRRLGLNVSICCVLSGETGRVLRHLLEEEGLTVVAVHREGRGATYLHDRRGGERREIAEELGDPLGRHDLDELYSVVLREGLASRLVILSGPAGENTLPADTYRRLAADLRQGNARVFVDLAGDRLDAAVEGGVDVLKVSHEELRDDGLIDDDTSVPAIMAAMRDLRRRGANTVMVTRASDPLLFLDAEGFLEVTAPELEVADTRGAGDSLTAGVAVAIARGEAPRDAVTLGAAAGALNVTRHGLGTGDAQAVLRLREQVAVRRVTDDVAEEIEQSVTGRVSPDGLAALAQQEEK
jgi:1-phosphofructokinase